MRFLTERSRSQRGTARLAAMRLLYASLAVSLPSCGGSSSPSAPSASGTPLLQGRYLLSVRPSALCSGFPAPVLEVLVQATPAAGRVELGGANATGSFQPQAAGSSPSGLLEVYASDVVVAPGVADSGRASFYVFAQASGGLAQAAGRDEVKNGDLTGSVTLYRTLDSVGHTDRCSVPGHAWSLTAR